VKENSTDGKSASGYVETKESNKRIKRRKSRKNKRGLQVKRVSRKGT